MAKEKNVAALSFLRDLFNFGVYKRSQGRVVRQVTLAAMGITFLLGALQLYRFMINPSQDSWYAGTGLDYILPGLIAMGGLWISYRSVNYPQFADFLIAVEAEMSKVSWPSKQELIRSSIVVIVLMFFLAGSLFLFDVIWQELFNLIGV
ncbi:MAG: preprotein translocase subunit SecE [Planctomycetaceae bacterium]|nr:preprotein translocase subunit SecE [Planctomycetaceae bacterium]